MVQFLDFDLFVLDKNLYFTTLYLGPKKVNCCMFNVTFIPNKIITHHKRIKVWKAY